MAIGFILRKRRKWVKPCVYASHTQLLQINAIYLYMQATPNRRVAVACRIAILYYYISFRVLAVYRFATHPNPFQGLGVEA